METILLKFGPFSALFVQNCWPKFGRTIVRPLHFLLGHFWLMWPNNRPVGNTGIGIDVTTRRDVIWVHFLWFEPPFVVKEIRREIEWLREIKTVDQHCYIFLLIQQIINNNVLIIACILELFKNPIIDLINREISAERERSIAIVSAPKTDKITIHANMEPHRGR